MAETFTPNLGLSKFGQNQRFPIVSAAKLNTNWDTIDEIITQALALIAAKADASALATLDADKVDQADFDDLLSKAILKDGSVSMEADLDIGTHKVKGVQSGASDDEAVNVGQLNAAIDAGLGSLGVVKAARVSRSTTQTLGTSATSASAIQYTTEERDDGGLFSGGANTKLTAPVDGWYQINLYAVASSAGNPTFIGYVNGSIAALAVQSQERINNIYLLTASQAIYMSAGDYLEIWCNYVSACDVLASVLTMVLQSENGAGGGDFLADGSIAMTADLDLGGFGAVNSRDAVADNELIPKGQVDDLIAGLQAQIDALSPDAGIDFTDPTIVSTGDGDGEFKTSSPTFVHVTNATHQFTLDAETKCIIHCIFTARRNQADADAEAFHSLWVNGGDNPFGGTKISLTSGQNGEWTVSVALPAVLPAGLNTIKLDLRSDGAHQVRIASNVDLPIRIWVQLQ